MNKYSNISWGKLAVAVCTAAYSLYYAKTPSNWHFIDNLDLVIHEAGHSIIFFLGEFVQIFAGFLFQILFPAVFIFYFYKRKEFFSASLLLFWLGLNFINISVYVSDAMAMQLPLLGGESSIHDWNYLLDSLNLLKYTEPIGSLFFGLGFLIIIAAAFFSVKNSHKLSKQINLLET